jgi:hypothetical protein
MMKDNPDTRQLKSVNPGPCNNAKAKPKRNPWANYPLREIKGYMGFAGLLLVGALCATCGSRNPPPESWGAKAGVESIASNPEVKGGASKKSSGQLTEHAGSKYRDGNGWKTHGNASLEQPESTKGDSALRVWRKVAKNLK